MTDPLAESFEGEDVSRRGVLAWMAKNHVAANVIMTVLVLGGLFVGSKVKQEVFPQFDMDLVLINVPYPGASPSEVEQGVGLAVEEAVRGLDGVKEVRTTASEGVCVVAVELLAGTDTSRALSDIKAAVDRITSLPEDIERPIISLATNRFQVLNLVVHGDKSEHELRALAERTRDELLADERVTFADLSAVRPYEIRIEVPQESLRRYGLTLERIAARIRAASVEIPGGAVKARSGEILVRTAERRLTGSEFADIVLLSRPDGTQVRVRDLAHVEDGFEESDQQAFFNGERAAMVGVYRVADQTPIEVSEAVHEYIDRTEARLPDGVHFAVWSDASDIYRDRIDLLMRNARIGLALVLLVLGLFLEIRLAFWVTLGIPISFLGALLFMPAMDVSINMISLFAFIVTLGMVVDDAIVVGEAVFRRRQAGVGPLDAAIGGVREVFVPVCFSIITTCIAFAPMLFVPGASGKFFRVIPIIVITVLILSLFESLLILPAHLAHRSKALWLISRIFFLDKLHAWVLPAQQRFSRGVERFIERVYAPFLSRALDWRYLTVATGLALLMLTAGLIGGGRIKRTFMPKIESDLIVARITLPYGTAIEDTERAKQQLESGLDEVLAQHGAGLARGVFAQLGTANGGGLAHPRGSFGSSGPHLAEVALFMVPVKDRDVTAAEVSEQWREATGEIPGIEALTFKYALGPAAGSAIDIELSHPDTPTLEAAAASLAQALTGYSGVTEVDDGVALGKAQLNFHVRPEGLSLGLTEVDLARQVRAAFFGVEAVRQQRGRNEVRTYVRRPRNERSSQHDLEQFIVRTPAGGEIPLAQAATVVRGRAYTQITRIDARRVLRVTAEVERGTNANEVVDALRADVLPGMLADTPGLRYAMGGQQREQQQTLDSLFSGGALALIVMFGLLAAAFRSYLQPVIIMAVAIPFSLVGAIGGHVLMGYEISLVSTMGMVALAGVAVNDSLVLVVAANEYRKTMPMLGAVYAAGVRRFRPIVLTSLTTFFGLMPMIVETSLQARFLIPMAISLGFGVLFATLVNLIAVPAFYVILEDLKARASAGVKYLWGEPAPESALPPPGE